MPPKGFKGKAKAPDHDHPTICLRCPDRATAENCVYTMNETMFKQCKTAGPKWRGFVSDPNQTLDFTEQECLNILSKSVEVDNAQRAEAKKEHSEANEASFEAAVSALKTKANAQYNLDDNKSINLSQELLEYAYAKTYGTDSAKAQSSTAQPNAISKGVDDMTVSDSKKSEASTKPEARQPPKNAGALRPTNPKDKSTGETASASLLTNHFELKFDDNKKLFEYRIEGLQQHADNIKANLSAPKKMVLLQRFIDKRPELNTKHHSFAFNKEGMVISCERLTNITMPGAIVLTDAVEDYSRDKAQDEDPRTCSLQMSFKREFDLAEFRAYAKGEDEHYLSAETAQAVEILIGQGVSQRNQAANQTDVVFKAGDNRFFPREAGHDLESGGLVALRGFSSHIKAAEGGNLLLSVNTAFSAFYKPMLVSEYIKGMTSSQATKHLAGVRVEIMYNRCKAGEKDRSMDSESRRTKTITGFSTKFADVQTFKKDSGEVVSVWNHFKDTYRDAARGSKPNQYCVNIGSTQVESQRCWFMPDMLRVVEGQIYRKTLDNVDASVTTKMIEFAANTPNDNQKAIETKGLSALGLQQGQPLPAVLHGSKISIDHNMMRVAFRHIASPEIHYKSGKIDFQAPAVWEVKGKKFSSTTKAITGGIGILHDGLDDSTIDGLIQDFTETVGTRYDIRIAGGFARSRQFDDVKNSSLVVRILSGSLKETRPEYARFRSEMDQTQGKVSIVFNTLTMGGGKLVSYLASNAMKINIRLGNQNHVLKKAFKPLEKNFKCNTLVLGADLVHPKQKSATCTPSIAALVGSIDGVFATFLGSARHQTKGSEYINEQSMYSMAKERIKVWKDKNNGVAPPRILYYRDGTGNTQYDDVRNHEITQIKRAWADLAGKTTKPLEMTTVVGIKRHTTRFFPIPGTGTETPTGNCKPGTVVDRGITSPYYFDFYLQSHDVQKKGTSAKPTHYFVLENGMNLTEHQLQDVTNDFCYVYAHSTNAVSYASPAYYADKLCERASLYLRRFYDGDDDVLAMTEDEQKAAVIKDWGRGGQQGNPWHPNLNMKMFWM